MNKFLKKKADVPTAKDDALHTLSQPPSPVMKKSSNSRWKKNNHNKRQPEPKPQIDLSVALPSTDDFRTSLIMPSLSTRFSMLREQDDPKSILGKASDDSVLQPRRKSRMADFGFGTNGLSDIAEVSSINGSARPSFVHYPREQSFVSEEGYGSEADATPSSMMGRSRPGEGNILFGGRQKVYKIPTSGALSTRSLGKVYYEDDVGMSAFQKYRLRERDVDESQFPRPSDESQGFDFGLDQAEPGCQDDEGLETLPNDSAKDLSHSPSLSSYDKKRSTTSSTARSDARSSTAATSIASQPAASAHPSPAQAPVSNYISTNTANSISSIPPAPMSAPVLDRSNTKTRRLYEQGLDQHMHEQQNSALSRLNSIQRQRALSGKKSPPMLHNAKSAGNLHDRNPQPVYALRAQSPPLTSPLPPPATFGSVRGNSGTSSPALSGPQSPIDSHFDENMVLTQALEPADRGKATAMGAFNKPAHAFDEQQYLQRQQALQRSTSNAAIKHRAQHFQSNAPPRVHRFEFEPEHDGKADAPTQIPDVPKKHEPSKAYNVFQNAVNALPAQSPAGSSSPASKSPLPDTHRTFFGNISASEDEDEDDDLVQSFNQPEYGYGSYPSKWQPTPLQPVSEHPALRSERSRSTLSEEVEEMEVRPLNTKASSRSLRSNDLSVNITAPKIPQDIDSPTLGPQAQPLNGMVHHLRQRSNQSSLYPQEDFALPEGNTPEIPEVPWTTNKASSYSNTLDTHSARDSCYATSNPWDLDEQSFVGEPRASRMTVSPVDEAPSARYPSNRASEISLVQDHDIPSWQQELRKQHTRDTSTATQQERDAFANELAERRRLIQERIQIRSIVERDSHSRGTSPAPSAGAAPAGPMRAFGMLRSKTSRDSFVNAQEQPLKAQKVLGVGSGHSPEVGRPRGNSSPRPPMPAAQHPAFKQDGPGPSRTMDMDPPQAERTLASAGRSPASSAGGARSRSNSVATTGRSRSRTGPYRDDLEKAMVEGHGSSAASHTPDMSPFPGASPDVMMNGVGRDSDDRKAMSNYFDQRHAPSSQGNASRLAHGGPSPVTLASNVYTPGRPAPVANPYSQNPTPPLAGSSPAITQADFNQIMQSNARAAGPSLRKKTISKSDISEPIALLQSTSNVDTVDLPPGASLKNGMDEPPPIPPINPRRRATRKLFGRNRSESTGGENTVKATASEPSLNTSPKREPYFPPSNVVRMPTVPAVPTTRDFEKSPPVQQYGFNSTESPERAPSRSGNGTQRAVTAPLEGGMF